MPSSNTANTAMKHVTNRQGVQLAEFVRSKKVLRGNFANFLKNEEKKEKFLKLLEDCKEFTSNIFQKTITISVSFSDDIFTITENSVKNLLKEVLTREAEKGNLGPYIDNDIWGWFKNESIQFFGNFSFTVYRFLSNLTHGQILEEAEKTGVKKIYTWLEAFLVVKEAVLKGEVDQKGTGIIVYFEIKNKLYRFHAYRFDDGQLRVRVDEVSLSLGLDAGDGACFSN
jgi:hypothetical protein